MLGSAYDPARPSPTWEAFLVDRPAGKDTCCLLSRLCFMRHDLPSVSFKIGCRKNCAMKFDCIYNDPETVVGLKTTVSSSPRLQPWGHRGGSQAQVPGHPSSPTTRISPRHSFPGPWGPPSMLSIRLAQWPRLGVRLHAREAVFLFPKMASHDVVLGNKLPNSQLPIGSHDVTKV